MKEELNKMLQQAMEDIEKAGDLEVIETLRVKYLGKKSKMSEILRGMGKLSHEDRRLMGEAANSVRDNIASIISSKKKLLKETERKIKMQREKIDVTQPGKAMHLGTKHPITITIEEITDVFKSMGFSICEGPEIETVYNNFDALNADKHHPARAMTDTFYLTEEYLLRTQTSPVQIRTIKKQKPPIKIISPGRCFRCDTADATHSPMFHQVEGLVIDEGITMADLKGTLNRFAKLMFGEFAKTKLRPHHFPFTEPSAEVDLSCFKCGGEGCSVCKGSGWIEILGCGMVHPNVLKEGNIDPEKYTGFAFGMGVERIAMLKYEIDDIRLFYENDMRFIEEFK